MLVPLTSTVCAGACLEGSQTVVPAEEQHVSNVGPTVRPVDDLTVPSNGQPLVQERAFRSEGRVGLPYRRVSARRHGLWPAWYSTPPGTPGR